ncbi:YfcC family protein [Bacillus massiliigorillae]|uniref:YfcC family protein n=1 Tax=Bacillus massiliigorillae TaxID=1243664 RepID=UPI00039ADA57|nr:AbgT family transporter [Bacillus massiliigorillae]
MTTKKKKKFQFPTAYTVLLALTIIVGLVTQFVPQVIPARVSDVLMAPITGMIGIKDSTIQENISEKMQNEGIPQALDYLKGAEGHYINVANEGSLAGAIDVAFFILIIGGFLGVVTKTGALDAGVAAIVNKMKGKELILIPILMIIFSLGGTSYGMAEESLAFYALITATMLAVGFDPLVAAATIMLGAGCGTLGSTVNPFAPGVAAASAKSVGVAINQGTIIILGVMLWLVTLAIAIFFVMSYAKKVKNDNSKSLLTESEWKNAKESYGNNNEETMEFTGRRKLVLVLFGISFLVMILGIVPWEDFGVTFFAKYTGMLTGSPLGQWSFPELAAWFAIMGIVTGMVYRLSEKDLVDSFIVGAADMVGVALILGISRGISFIMSNSGLDLFILDKASNVLNGISGIAFVGMAYLIYIGLSFLIPSSSGLATVSMPIFAPLTKSLGLSPEVMIMVFSAGSGFVNLFTPTSGVVMGGLSIAKVEYSTWLKFVWKVLIAIFIASIAILAVGMMIF